MSGADEYGQAAGDKWGDEISDERKAALEQRLHAWEQEAAHGERKGPFDGVELTGADAFWLVARTLARTDEQQAVAQHVHLLHRLRHEPDTVALWAALSLDGLHLEGAALRRAHLGGAALRRAHLEGADLGEAHLGGAALRWTHLEGAALGAAHLEGADLSRAHLQGAGLVGAYLEAARLREAHLEGADLRWAHLERGDLVGAHLQGADLGEAHLEGAALGEAHLEGADLGEAHLQGRVYRPDEEDFLRVQQWADDSPLALAPADLRGAYFDGATTLNDVALGKAGYGRSQGYVRVADVRWGGVNLAVVKEWPPEMMLGDEREAWAWQPPKREAAKKRNRKERAEARHQQEKVWQDTAAQAEREQLELFRAAVRANRQLATALREQGMNEEADRFAYRAQVCQRRLFSLQHQWGRWLLQTLLALLAGYGFRLGRIFTAYVAVLLVFATIYFLIGLPNTGGGFTLDALRDAFLVSLTAIHGRVFLEQLGQYSLQAWVAAIESVTGIVIEGVFVAMLAQRFFGGR